MGKLALDYRYVLLELSACGDVGSRVFFFMEDLHSETCQLLLGDPQNGRVPFWFPLKTIQQGVPQKMTRHPCQTKDNRLTIVEHERNIPKPPSLQGDPQTNRWTLG